MDTSLIELAILLLGGDGVGLEINNHSPNYLKKLIKKFNKKHNANLSLQFAHAPFGTSALISHGAQIPDETKKLLQEYNLIIKPPSRTPNEQEMEIVWKKWYSHLDRETCFAELKKLTSANVGLRQLLSLYACKRPIMHYPGVPTNFKKSDEANFIVFRENTEGFYGMPNMTSEESAELVRIMKDNPLLAKHASKLDKNDEYVIAFGQCSKIATKRIMRAAIEQAIKDNRKIVTIAHKGNIMKGIFGAFTKWCLEVATEEYGDQVVISKWKVNKAYAYAQDKIIIDDIIIDNCSEKAITRPNIFDVIVMENLQADIFTDEAAGLIGGLGVAPGTNINYETGKSVYEATHGTADDIAGKDMVNPSSWLLSFFMLCEDQGGIWSDFSTYCKNAIAKTFANGQLTGDLASQIDSQHPKLSTTEFFEAIVANAA